MAADVEARDGSEIAPNPLRDARTQLAEAIELLGLNGGMYDVLATPRREVTVSIPLRRDDGTIEVFDALSAGTEGDVTLLDENDNVVKSRHRATA